MDRKINSNQAIAVIASVSIIVILIIIGFSRMQLIRQHGDGPTGVVGGGPGSSELTALKRFSSEEDFKRYLEKGQELSSITGQSFLGGLRQGISDQAATMNAPLGTEMGKLEAAGMGGAEPQRYSETNVQVAGIDEPDVVKTDGKEIYYSAQDYSYGIMPVPMDNLGGREPYIAPEQRAEIKNIRAFPLDDLKLDGKIDKAGQLLLNERTLVVLPQPNAYQQNGNKILGYDVNDPASPKEKWNVEIKDNNQLIDARLKDGKIYAVVKNFFQPDHPCLLNPLAINGKPFSLSCIDIYHPVTPVPVDATFTVIALDATTGELKNTISFVGSASQSAVYMSPDSIYVTYYFPGDFVAFSVDFMRENKDLVPEWLIEKIEQLGGYDLGGRAKLAELEDALSRFQNSLSSDERRRVENEFRNRMEDFFKKHKRELEKTGIIKISASDLSIAASGSVPGNVLNQFSLDEHKDNLRIATTIGSGWWGFGFGGSRDSANDIYVLNSGLQAIGSIQDLGLDERIYSARFIGDRGYLVTFRETDPFFVLDLSDPKNPEKKGEIKIPGFSSYLHPISADMILGVGEEDGQVKLSLFDVKDPQNPQETSKYHLDEYYSEVSQTHHAFLMDSRHSIFFLPGSQGAYVFSYEDNVLKLLKAVSDISMRRAVYIDDFLYIIGDDKIAVLDEKNWEMVKELDL